jgi:hypothetical protein
MCKGEGDAFKACGDNINSVTTVVGEGRAKVVGTVSVWIPRETVVGAVESKTELTGGMDGMRRSRREDGGGPTKQREGSGRHGRMILRVVRREGEGGPRGQQG